MPRERQSLIRVSSTDLQANRVVLSNADRSPALDSGQIVARETLSEEDQQALLAHRDVLLNPPRETGERVLLGGCPRPTEE